MLISLKGEFTQNWKFVSFTRHYVNEEVGEIHKTFSEFQR